MAAPLNELERKIGHEFADAAHLAEALRHSSAVADPSDTRANNERLEFLGDRVLGLVVANLLFHRFPGEAEGEIARRFAALTSRTALLRVAEGIGLEPYIDVAESERIEGTPPAILADACEALIAALYLDGGLDVAAGFVGTHWTPLMEEDLSPPKDAKTTLQEWCQARSLSLPAYRVSNCEGPSHAPHFTVEVTIDTGEGATGEGSSKRIAEQLAAERLLDVLS